jgi:hypothetical protein
VVTAVVKLGAREGAHDGVLQETEPRLEEVINQQLPLPRQRHETFTVVHFGVRDAEQDAQVTKAELVTRGE